MNRKELGLRLQQWHASMYDPVYAVGSFYFAGQKYPKKEIAQSALVNLQNDLDETKRMLVGESIKVVRNNSVVDLRTFAGYSDEELQERIDDLEEIIKELKRFIEKDY